MLDKRIEDNFVAILEEELIPAMGCTEPIALAYASAKARQVLGSAPEKITAECSGNMIKNVRCVSIPNSDGMIGIEAACALGALAGDADRCMEVLEAVDDEGREKARQFVDAKSCRVEFLDSEIPLHFIIRMMAGTDNVMVEVRHSHTNIVKIEKNGTVLLKKIGMEQEKGQLADRSDLTIDNIKKFADSVDLGRIRHLFDRQIQYNMDIAYEGMSGNYGLGLGRMIRETYAESVVTRMKAYACAASEARMGGCDMPVIINSGSGNQGIASSVPVIVYARENNISSQRLYRALAFSSLITTYQKEFIGKLSAFCGAVSASCASAAAITYLAGGTTRQIKDTIDNTLANIPGIICDGAKISCAAKIASSLDAAMMGHYLSMQGKAYEAYTGILKEDAEETISCVGYIGKVGMHQTDKEIIKMMLSEEPNAEAAETSASEASEAYAYVDGSYNVNTKVYGYGGFLMHEGGKEILMGNGSDEEMALMRNVAGEISGSIAAVKKAIELGIKELTIYYDYAGIEHWALGTWKRNKTGTKAYYEYMQSVKDKIALKFVKVTGHSGIEGNEEADSLAKQAVGIK